MEVTLLVSRSSFCTKALGSILVLAKTSVLMKAHSCKGKGDGDVSLTSWLRVQHRQATWHGTLSEAAARPADHQRAWGNAPCSGSAVNHQAVRSWSGDHLRPDSGSGMHTDDDLSTQEHLRQDPISSQAWSLLIHSMALSRLTAALPSQQSLPRLFPPMLILPARFRSLPHHCQPRCANPEPASQTCPAHSTTRGHRRQGSLDP